MERFAVICWLGLLLLGASLVSRNYRRLGGLLSGLALAVFLMKIPWSVVDLGIRQSAFFRRIFAPRLVELELLWRGLSVVSGIALCLWVALKEVLGHRSDREGFRIPTRCSGLDSAVDVALTRNRYAGSTVLGLAGGGRKVFLTPHARESHMQIVGPTRSGKSQLLFALAGQDMAQGLPVFFMEAKGDRSDFDQFLKLADRAGRSAAVRYFNPQDARSMTFNPIRRLPGQDPTAVANQIARAIGREITSSGDGQDYYRSLDYAQIQNMAEVFCATGRQFTLKDCFYYFSNEQARAKAFALCDDKGLTKLAKEGFKHVKDSSALTSALRPWTTGFLGKLLNSYSPEITLENVFAKDQLAYFAIPIGQLQVLANPLGRMVISALLSAAAARQQTAGSPRPASVILDEFAEFATPVFTSFIATVGSAGFRTILSHQDLGQLQKVEGMRPESFASAVFNNTSGCKICFRTPDPEDAEFWSSMVGTYRAVEDTERFYRGLTVEIGTGEKSRREVEVFKIHPNLLKNLARGTALVFVPGSEECLIKTARVFPLLSGMEVPRLRPVEVEPQEGLHLAEAADKKRGVKGMDNKGIPE